MGTPDRPTRTKDRTDRHPRPRAADDATAPASLPAGASEVVIALATAGEDERLVRIKVAGPGGEAPALGPPVHPVVGVVVGLLQRHVHAADRTDEALEPL